ncbi:MAG: flagellar biosynthesis anti-sigma factor FlgM [Treponema sp.]|jgi:negative regulator of flagellin synthesis FlgM|nr:flagellar biosynthesis anti-sigma factor FlgM [Treponema sp.]
MMIDKIGGLNPLNNVQNIRKTDSAAKVSSQTDSISVSKEAVEKAEAYYLDKVAAETPNVRADRIAEVKAKIKDPSYLSDEVILSTAEKVMSGFGI